MYFQLPISSSLAKVIYNKNAYSTHTMFTYVELVVILAGVFLKSFFCVLPGSSYSSDPASSSLLVAWYSTAVVQLVAPGQQWLQKLTVQLHSSLRCGVRPI